MGTQPNLGVILDGWWGGGCGSIFGGYAPSPVGFIFGTNPPYTATDFLAFYPNFGGIPTNITGTVTNGSASITVSSITNLGSGQLVTGNGIPGGATIVSVSGSTVTISAVATVTGTLVPLTVYTVPFLPLAVLNAYILLATASLSQALWRAQWPTAMALFIAHYGTLFLKSSGSPASTPGQLAAQGLQIGLLVSKSVGGVSGSYQTLNFAEFGAWALTLYGQQLATMAAVIAGIPSLYIP